VSGSTTGPVVSNSTPLFALAGIGRLDVLCVLYGTISIPPGVWDEVVTQGEGLVEAAEVRDAAWIEVVQLADPSAVARLRGEVALDLGEAEAIVLSEQLGPELLLIDELRERRECVRRGRRIVGTLGASRWRSDSAMWTSRLLS